MSRDQLKTMVAFGEDGRLHIDTSRKEWRAVNRPRLSPSLISSLHGCLASVVADKLISWPSGPFDPNSLGTAAHAALEDLYALPPHERTEESFAHCVRNLPFTHADSITLPEAKDLSEWKAMVFEYGVFEVRGTPQLGRGPDSIHVFQREMKVETEIDGIPFKGFIDRLDAVGDGWLRVVDYKTGKLANPAYPPDKGARQQVDYALALSTLGYKIASAELHFTKIGVIQEVPLTEQSATESRVALRYAWDALQEMNQTQSAPTTPSGLCNWCLIEADCPVSIAQESKKSEKARRSVELGIPTPRVK